jgi:hypothetical protein
VGQIKLNGGSCTYRFCSGLPFIAKEDEYYKNLIDYGCFDWKLLKCRESQLIYITWIGGMILYIANARLSGTKPNISLPSFKLPQELIRIEISWQNSN